MVDITVMGAGIFGLSIAWTCARRGASVQVIDPNGVAGGSSGGVVGALAPHVPENWNPKKAFQFDSLIMAAAFWADVAAAGGQNPGYVRAGRLQAVADDAALALAKARGVSARDLWQGKATWDVIPTPNDWAPHSATGWVVHDTLSAHIHPAQACRALASALMGRGVSITTAAAPKGKVIWATGAAGLQMLNAELGVMTGQGIKGQAAVLQYDMARAPQLFANGVHVVPHLDGTVAIGSTTERDYTDASGTDAQLDAVIAAARLAVPALRDAPVIARWAGLRPRSRSRAPMLGAWPDRAGHFIANGGFKIGFGMAPKVAQVMADLVLDENNTIPQGFTVADNLPKGN